MNNMQSPLLYTLLGDTAFLVALFTVLVFIAGWTYAYVFYAHFEIGLLQLDIPNRYFLMYGFWVLKVWWGLWAIVWAVIWLLYAGRQHWLVAFTRCAKFAKPGILFQALGLALSFYGIAWLASVHAQQTYRHLEGNRFQSYPHVALTFAKEATRKATRQPELTAALAQAEFRLLLQNKETLWLFKPSSQSVGAKLATIQIKRNQIHLLRILP